MIKKYKKYVTPFLHKYQHKSFFGRNAFSFPLEVFYKLSLFCLTRDMDSIATSV